MLHTDRQTLQEVLADLKISLCFNKPHNLLDDCLLVDVLGDGDELGVSDALPVLLPAPDLHHVKLKARTSVRPGPA